VKIKNDLLRAAITTSLVSAIVFTETAFSSDHIFTNAKLVEFESVSLILSGSEDSQIPAELCEQYVDKLQPEHEITLKVFAGAHHLFDHPGIDTIDAGYIIRSNPEAAAEASQMSREFLEEWL
jgi:dienelactone hydrolase